MSRESWRVRRRRDLTAEERALWAKIAETVRPLSGRRLPAPPEPPPQPAAPPSPAAKAGPKPAQTVAAKPQPKPPKPLTPIEPKLARTLRRGGEVDARLDLHGLRQEEAHARLRSFLTGAQARGARVVLVITGKGKPGGALFDERGVLRRQVPIWLAEPGLRTVVLGFSEASAPHGGSGALYVRLRRER